MSNAPDPASSSSERGKTFSTMTSSRIIVNVATLGATSAQLRAQYSTDLATWNYLDASNGPASGVINTTGLKVSAYSALVAGAKADVYLRIVGTDGDGVADPAFGQIEVQFK